MKKHIFVKIRYSVLTKKNKGSWRIGRGLDEDSYKESLFSNLRLQLHEELFNSVTLPSIRKLSKENSTILIFTSKELPSPFLDRLYKCVESDTNIKIISLAEDCILSEEINFYMEKEILSFNEDLAYASVRLDDDDALADDFETQLMHYITPLLNNHVITFSNGYEGIYNEQKYVRFIEINRPKESAGLALIQLFKKNETSKLRTIFSLGNHSKIDEKSPMISNPYQPMYIHTVHRESDFYAHKFEQKLSNTKSLVSFKKEDLITRFSFLKN